MAASGLSCCTWDLRSSMQHVESLAVACGILSPDQGSNSAPLHCESGVLATGPPYLNLNLLFFQFRMTSITTTCLTSCFPLFHLFSPASIMVTTYFVAHLSCYRLVIWCLSVLLALGHQPSLITTWSWCLLFPHVAM